MNVSGRTVRARWALMVLVLGVVLSSCSHGTGPGQVHGVLFSAVSPPAHPLTGFHPVAGEVKVYVANDELASAAHPELSPLLGRPVADVSVPSGGHFTVELPAGSYLILGTQTTTRRWSPVAKSVAQVQAGSIVNVRLVCA